MADNVIPFPIRNQRLDASVTETAQVKSGNQTVTREEMIQLVLRYAYGTQWAQEPRTADKPADD